MSDNEFALHLGGGWYVDAAGRLHSEPIVGAPTYELPGHLPVDPKVLKNVSDAFKNLAGVMPNKDDPKSVAKFTQLGLPGETIKFLSILGVVAGLAATTFGVAAFVFAVAKMAGFFEDQPDPLMLKLDDVKKELEAFDSAIEDDLRDQMIVDIQSQLTPALNGVSTFIEQLKVYPLNETSLENRLQDLRNMETEAAKGALRATNTLSWLRGFDVNEYTGSWFWISRYLQVHPEGEAPRQFVLWKEGDRRMDHRVMVPVVLYAVQAYLTVIKGITPEYRSTGEFRDNIRSLATAVAALASNMRAQGLAKVIYRPEDFLLVSQGRPPYFLGDSEKDPPIGDPNEFTLYTHFTVGAVDLAIYTDLFIRAQLIDPNGLPKAWIWDIGNAPIPCGALEFYWQPPVPYSITTTPNTISYDDPVAAAAAANAIAEERYAELLVSSGYLQLVHQATLLRHLSTEPDVSETVTGALGFSRSVVSSETVTAESPPIPFTGVISEQATKEHQSWGARAWINTQPRGHQRMIPYRVMLRSISLFEFGQTVRDPDYGFYQTSYEDDPALPGFKALKVDFATSRLLGEVELASGESPPTEVARHRTTSLLADSFDWYVPFHSPFGKFSAAAAQADVVQMGAQGSGKKPAQVPPLMTMDRPLVPSGTVYEVFNHPSFGDFLWNESAEVRGERRHLARETIHIDWSLQWTADRLVVTLKGRPEDRNCVLFLVMEETLISGQRLHTPFLIRINNQITLVPQSFFDEENRAWKHASALVGEINRRFTKSATPGLGGPVEGRINPGDFHSRPGLERIAAFYERRAPELVRQVAQSYQRTKD